MNVRFSVNRRFESILAISFLIVLTMACEPNERRIIAENRSLIDSLANQQIKALRIELDSICDLEFEARVEAASDSIMQVRIEEIKKLLGK